MRPLNILIWHVHGNYLYYLTARSPHRFYLPYNSQRSVHYTGRSGRLPWGDNVSEVPVERVRDLPLDCAIFQSSRQYLEDQHRMLSKNQLNLPKIFLEHDPPQLSPTETRHPVDDPNVLLVHVTHYNELMWNNGRTPTRVIEHGVTIPGTVHYSGELERGIVVANHLARRGRRLGHDIYLRVRERIPLDHVGMAADEVPGGLEEIDYAHLSAFCARYRFFFNPIRYTSMPLSVVEAMMAGLPVVGLATTEMAAVIENGRSGYIDTNVSALIERMAELLRYPAVARRLGEGARRTALERFSLARFVNDWNRVLAEAVGLSKGWKVSTEGASSVHAGH